jgi:hypothetical protein
MLARDHLERWDHDQQASDDRDARRDRDHGEQENYDTERPLMQAANQPLEAEVVRRRLVMKPL